jgi:prepilin-type N-terminal cleavage/methylation domain-containing protein
VRRDRGYSLLEVVVAMSVFLMFLAIVATVASEIRRMEKKYPVNFMVHPQVSAVVSRIRRDVMDATKPYYPGSYGTYTQGARTLILYSLQPNGFAQHVVYDFSKSGEVRRLSFNVGVTSSDWVARGVPTFIVTDFPVEGHPTSVRIKAFDQNGKLAIDQIFQPRPHEE